MPSRTSPENPTRLHGGHTMGRPFFSKTQRHSFSKLTSLAVSFAFLFTSVITPANATLSPVQTASPVESALVKQLTPPSDLGTIIDAFTARDEGSGTRDESINKAGSAK